MQRLILATSFLPKKTRTKSKSKDLKPNAAYARAGRRQPHGSAGTLFPIAVGSHAGQDWSSKEGHRADALALRADERRDKLR